MIGQIERLGAYLEGGLLAEMETARDGEVDDERAGAVQNIAAGTAEAVCAKRDDRELSAVEPLIDGRRGKRAFADAIGTAGFAVGVVEIRDFGREGLASVDGAAARELPVLQQDVAGEGRRPDEAAGEGVADIEIGASSLASEVARILRRREIVLD